MYTMIYAKTNSAKPIIENKFLRTHKKGKKCLIFSAKRVIIEITKGDAANIPLRQAA